MNSCVFDRTYDILLSYRRTDSSFVEALAKRLNKLDIRCFVDSRVHENGWEWKKFWDKALEKKPNAKLDLIAGSGIVVIATDAMLEKKIEDQVVREIRKGFDDAIGGQHEIPITLLCFGHAGAEELQRRLGPQYDLKERHHPHTFDDVATGEPDAISEETWGRICRAVARTSRGTTVRRLQQLKEEARSWARSILRTIWSEVDFSTTTESADRIRNALNQSIANHEISRLAIVGPGGFGKTVQLARTLDHLLNENPELLFPVVVKPHELKDGAALLRKKLGLSPDPSIEPLSLVEGAYAWAQGRIFFIVDSLEHSDRLETIAAELRSLNTTAAIWITSRPEAWQAVKGILTFGVDEIVQTSEINTETAAKVLGCKYGKVVRKRPYLQQPVFLDIATYLLHSDDLSRNSKELAMENETALLDTLLRWACDYDEGTVGAQDQSSRRELLRAIAVAQIKQGRFDISRDELLDVDPSLAEQRNEALHYLCRTRPLLIELVGAERESRIRLRHDIVDSHNISKRLLDKPELRKKMLNTFDRGFNQIVYEGVAQTAYDLDRPEIIDEFFLFFLLAIDNKHDEHYQPIAWNTGYVITAKVAVFLNQLRKTLCGDFLGNSLPKSPGEAVSSLDPPALTQAALSSVASMFGGARPISIPDPDGVLLRALYERVKSARYRGRLMEAIAKIDDQHDGAIAILERFGSDQVALRADQPLAIYIANGLADIARSRPSLCKRTINAINDMVALLENEADEIDLPILRILYRRINAIQEIDNQPPVPEPVETEREFLQGLRLYEWRNVSRFSDWAVFEYYCHRIRTNHGIFDNEISLPVVLALGRGFWHDHVRCHEKAASALGAINHPFARGILLHILTFETNDRTTAAVIAALEKQTLHLNLKGHKRIAFLRALKRAAAERYARVDTFKYRPNLFLKLLPMIDFSDAGIVTAGCIEITPFDPVVQFSSTPSRLTQETQWPWLTDEEKNVDVGPELEQKVAILTSSKKITELQYFPASWAVPARAHRAITTRMASIKRKTREKIFAEAGKEELMRYDTSLEQQIEAAAHLYAVWEEGFESAFLQPAIAAVHVVITTADAQLVKARRSPEAFYYPGAWAATFEEQIQLKDLESLPVLTAIVSRGLREEFKVELDSTELDIVSASLFMEWPILNPVILIHAYSHRPGNEFLDSDLSTQASPEIIDRVLVPLSEIKSRMWQSRVGFHSLASTDQDHPTSVARMVLAIAKR